MTREELFWSKVEVGHPLGCWEWTRPTEGKGYGKFWDGERTVKAHRYAYELLLGPIPDGMQLDHLCRVRACVNPDHLEAVTQRENIRRGAAGKMTAAQQRAKTHCPRGHAYAGDNLYVYPDGRRRCRACQREHDRNYRKAA